MNRPAPPLLRTGVLCTRLLCAGLCAGLLAAAPAALGQSSVTWTIDQTITSDQSSAFWTSPTAIDLNLDAYFYDYEITTIEADARFLFTTITVDVTDPVGDSFPLAGGGEAPSLPAVLLNERLDDPTSGTSADVLIEVDSSGFGQASFTNIMLGQVDTAFGTLDIEAIRVEAVIVLEGIAFDAADYTADGAVDQLDYQRWVQEYGDSGPQVTADGNGDLLVDAADYTVWRDRSESPLAAAAAPEPAAAALVAVALLGAATGRR
ncbi:hypothetical protein [Botrimarina sp.]|uniref:hypothetical protein n=1 Tax=Botrimarina sp. TaxID=2795802 RepID=UPI0032F068F9